MSYTFRVSNGDLYLDAGGKVEVIEGSEKTNQDLADVQMTVYDEDTNWGSTILDMVGNTTQALPGINGFITNAVLDAVELLQDYQRADQYATADERIDAVTQLVVVPVGKLRYQYYLVCQLEDDTQIPSGMAIELDQQYALAEIMDVVIT